MSARYEVSWKRYKRYGTIDTPGTVLSYDEVGTIGRSELPAWEEVVSDGRDTIISLVQATRSRWSCLRKLFLINMNDAFQILHNVSPVGLEEYDPDDSKGKSLARDFTSK